MRNTTLLGFDALPVHHWAELAIVALVVIGVFIVLFTTIPQPSLIEQRLGLVQSADYRQEAGGREALFARVFNDTQKSSLRKKLDEAGWYTVTPGKMGLRLFAGFVIGLGLGILGAIFTVAMVGHAIAIAMVFFLAGGGAYVPFSQLRSAAVKRKTEISRALPDVLDLLSTSVGAGLAFNAALGVAAQAAPGALGAEFRQILSEVRIGRSRADALKSFADRVRIQDVGTMVTAIVQAERLGANLGKVLVQISEEVRNKRMMRAEEIAAMMPMKMVFPMALLMLPALFVMIFGGVVAQYMSQAH